MQDYGLVCDLEANADVAAFVAPHQVGARVLVDRCPSPAPSPSGTPSA